MYLYSSLFFFFKQKTAYEMRISDWSSDVCSSDLLFVAPKWTPQREDLAVELAGEIEAEEMTLAERAAIKAERLDGLAHKRHAEANSFARRADELSQAFHIDRKSTRLNSSH